MNKGLCEECSYYRELKYKPALNAHLCELCYDLPTDKRNTEMRMNEYQELAKRTMPKETNEMSKSNYAMGLAGEAGEVVDLIKKEVHHGHPAHPLGVKEELGDLMHYVAGVATMYSLTLEEICSDNIVKLKKRFPDGFNTTDSIKRVDVNDHR